MRYLLEKLIDMVSDRTIRRILRESIDDLLLIESIPSKMLSDYFSQHGGVNRQYSQDGLGDVTDDQIAYMQKYKTRQEATDFLWKIRRDPKYNKYFPTVYTAKDGTSAVVFFDRNKVDTGLNWGGEHFKKLSDRIWRDDHDPNAKNQKNDVYYYGGGNQVPTNDFGLRTNANYKGLLNDLEGAKERFKDYYTPKAPRDDRGKFKRFFGIDKPKKPSKSDIEAGRQKGEDEYNAWRDREHKHMKDYLNKHWRWHRRGVKDGPRTW